MPITMGTVVEAEETPREKLINADVVVVLKANGEGVLEVNEVVRCPEDQLEKVKETIDRLKANGHRERAGSMCLCSIRYTADGTDPMKGLCEVLSISYGIFVVLDGEFVRWRPLFPKKNGKKDPAK